jgi:hypothetical protein
MCERGTDARFGSLEIEVARLSASSSGFWRESGIFRRWAAALSGVLWLWSENNVCSHQDLFALGDSRPFMQRVWMAARVRAVREDENVAGLPSHSCNILELVVRHRR